MEFFTHTDLLNYFFQFDWFTIQDYDNIKYVNRTTFSIFQHNTQFYKIRKIQRWWRAWRTFSKCIKSMRLCHHHLYNGGYYSTLGFVEFNNFSKIDDKKHFNNYNMYNVMTKTNDFTGYFSVQTHQTQQFIKHFETRRKLSAIHNIEIFKKFVNSLVNERKSKRKTICEEIKMRQDITKFFDVDNAKLFLMLQKFTENCQK